MSQQQDLSVEPSQALERREIAAQELERLLSTNANGSTGIPSVATAIMRWALETQFLASPVIVCPSQLAPGVQIAFSRVMVDPDSNDVYKPFGGSGLALHANAWERIGTGIGINWTHAIREDDGSEPLRCRMFVKGWYYAFDMPRRTEIMDIGSIDLTEGSDLCKKLLREAKSESAGRQRIEQMRIKIEQHATTNGRMRAVVHSFGFKQSYSHEELKSRGFVCVRPIATFRSENPATQAIFDTEFVRAMTHSSDVLYGQQELMPHPLPPAFGQPTQDVGVVAETEATVGEMASGQGEGAGNVPAMTEAQQTPSVTPDSPKPPIAYVLRSGKPAGKSVPALTDSALSMLVGYYDNLTGDEAQLADIKLDRAALLAEVASRRTEQEREPQQEELKL